MNEDEFDELLTDCPKLYHMAEKGSWPSIQKHGLLSTSALLDLYEVGGAHRPQIESSHRPNSVPLASKALGGAVVRDQKPMSDATLEGCLKDGLSPSDWYELLNSKVFFWLTEDRLLKLLGAKAYRDKEHDVLVINSRSLVEKHRENIWLSPMNSGASIPFKHPRGRDTFTRIIDYPYADWRKKRKRGERVVELCVDAAVPDIKDHVIQVRSMEGDAVKGIIQ